MPNDYKRFIENYGTGVIGMKFFVENFLASPGEAKRHLAAYGEVYERLSSQGPIIGEALSPDGRRLRDEFVDFPFRMFPAPNGLFPWGYAQDRWNLYWRTEGQPDDWDVVAICNLREFWCRYEGMGLVEFLVSMCRQPFLDGTKLVPVFKPIV